MPCRRGYKNKNLRRCNYLYLLVRLVFLLSQFIQHFNWITFKIIDIQAEIFYFATIEALRRLSAANLRFLR
jgi:hypothetical protein